MITLFLLLLFSALAYRPCPKVTITKYEVPNRFQSTTTSGCYISSDDANIFDRFIPSTNYTFNLTLTNSIGVVSRAYSITISKIGKSLKKENTYLFYCEYSPSFSISVVTYYNCNLKSDYSVYKKRISRNTV